MPFDSPDPKDSTPYARNQQKAGLVGINEKYHMPPLLRHRAAPFMTNDPNVMKKGQQKYCILNMCIRCLIEYSIKNRAKKT